MYSKVASTSPSHFEAHANLFRLKGIFDAYVLSPFNKKLIFELVMQGRTRNSINTELYGTLFLI